MNPIKAQRLGPKPKASGEAFGFMSRDVLIFRPWPGP